MNGQPAIPVKVSERARSRSNAMAGAFGLAPKAAIAVPPRPAGNFAGRGYRIEWYDFLAVRESAWETVSHFGGVELCLNLNGDGCVENAGSRLEFSPATVGFYRRRETPLVGRRKANQRHEFLTVNFSGAFLAEHLAGTEAKLHPLVRAAVENKLDRPGPPTAAHLTAGQQQIVATLRHPPVYSAAQPLWYRCKALELAVTFFFQPPLEEELFCSRQHRLAQERVEQVILLLKQGLAEPLSLEELGRKIGCSPAYLSRTFSSETGQTISQYLRRLRMEKAAELLRLRELNVTEVALEVGYSSPSHFSQIFHETFGCCPGLYPIRTVANLPAGAKVEKY